MGTNLLKENMLCIGSTLVHPLSVFFMIERFVAQCFNNALTNKTIFLKWSGKRTGLKINEQAANIQRKSIRKPGELLNKTTSKITRKSLIIGTWRSETGGRRTVLEHDAEVFMETWCDCDSFCQTQTAALFQPAHARYTNKTGFFIRILFIRKTKEEPQKPWLF